MVIQLPKPILRLIHSQITSNQNQKHKSKLKYQFNIVNFQNQFISVLTIPEVSIAQYDYQDEVIARPVNPVDYKNETLYYGGKLRRKPRSKKGGALYVAGARSGGGSLFPA